jgi:anti-sigma regulatory factor (Ser/Thr protein kinase)
MLSRARFTEFADEGARAAGLLLELDLILEEIPVNDFRYAYPSGAGKPPSATPSRRQNCLRIDVRDRGSASNPPERSAPGLDASRDNRPIGIFSGPKPCPPQ